MNNKETEMYIGRLRQNVNSNRIVMWLNIIVALLLSVSFLYDVGLL